MDFGFISKTFNFLRGGRGNMDMDRYTLPIQVHSADFQDYFNQLVNHKVKISISGNESEIYKTTSDIGTVIGRKAKMASNGRFKVYDYATDELIDIKKNSRVSDVIKLLERPNNFQTGAEFYQAANIFMSLYGNLFIYQNFATSISEVPASMMLLPPDRMEIVPTGKIFNQIRKEDIIKEYRLDIGNGKYMTFKPNEIIHLKNFNPGNMFVGLSKLEQLGIDISNTRVAKGFLNAVSAKMGSIGALTPDGLKANEYNVISPIEDKDRLKIEKQFSEGTHGIFDRQSKIKISSLPLKWVSFTAPIREHQILEQLDDNKRAIIDIYGLNENIFSKKGGSKYDNLLEGEKQAYTSTIIPESEELTDAIVKSWSFFENNNMYLKLDYSHCEALKSDNKIQSEINLNNVNAIAKLVELGYTKEEALDLVSKGIV